MKRRIFGLETEYGITTIDNVEENSFDVIIIAVGHRLFKEMGIANIRKLGRENNIIFDLKYIFDSDEADLKL